MFFLCTMLMIPLAIVMGFLTFGGWVFLHKSQSERSSVSEMTDFVHQCAGLFLRQQYGLILKVLLLLSGLMFFGSFFGHFNHFFGLVIFTGGLWGGVIGYFSLKFSIAAAAKVVEKVQRSAYLGARLLFVSGSVLVTVCISILLADIGIWLLVLNWVFDHNVWGLSLPILRKISYFQQWEPGVARWPAFLSLKYELISVILMSYAIGASVQAMITRVVGGVFRVGTHLGAENAFLNSSIPLPEDDIRNPGVFADMVGRNVSGVSGALSGLIQLVSVAVALATYLGVYLFESLSLNLHIIFLPLVILGIGLLGQIVGVWALMWPSAASNKPGASFVRRLKQGVVIAVGVNLLGCGLLALTGVAPLMFVLSAGVGVLMSTCVLLYMVFFARHTGVPVTAMRRVDGFGAALLKSVELGFLSAIFPLLCTLGALFLSYFLANGAQSLVSGMYGVAICAVAAIGNSLFFQGLSCAQPMASTGVSLSRMLQDETAEQRLSELDVVASAAGTGSAYSVGMSLFLLMGTTITAVLILLKHWVHTLAGEKGIQIGGTYFANHPVPEYPQAIVVSEIHIFDLAELLGIRMINPQLVMGLLFGVVTVIVIVFLCVRQTNGLSGPISQKAKDEFEENPDIAIGHVLPNYGDIIQFATSFSIRSVLAPFVWVCFVVVFVGLVFGVSGAVGHVFGLLLGVVMVNFSLGSIAAVVKQARLQKRISGDTDQGAVLRILGNVFAAVPDCVQPILNTVVVFVLSLALLLTIFSLKFGHMLVL